MILTDLRKKNRIKQLEIAKLSGIHRSTLSMYENGWLPLKRVHALALIAAYRTLKVECEPEIMQLIEKD